MRLWPVAIIALAVAFLFALDSVPVRHAAVLGMGRCAVHQFVGMPNAVDFLALGSSRVRQGISTQAIEAASGGMLRNNFNLGRSGLSLLRDYVTLRDLVRRGVHPRFVFLELDLDALVADHGTAAIPLPRHAGAMTYSDAGLLQQAHPQLDAVSRARLTVLLAFEKVRGALGAVFSGAPLHSLLDTAAAPPADCQSLGNEELVRIGRLQLQQRRQQQVAQPVGLQVRQLQLASDSAPARQQTLFWLGRIRALCRHHGIGLVVARHGAAYEPPLSAFSTAAVRALVPEFVQPPPDLVRASWSEFDDTTHMGEQARVRYSTWLVGQLLDKAAP